MMSAIQFQTQSARSFFWGGPEKREKERCAIVSYIQRTLSATYIHLYPTDGNGDNADKGI